jgi:integrase
VTITIKIVNSTEPVYITKQGVTRNTNLVTPQEAISTQKPKYNKVLLRIASEIDFPKVRTFLESVGRNSRNSRATYETWLKHFQRFLVGNTSTSNNYQNCNVETIIQAIQAGGSINVYELMDGFVSYFVVRLSHEQHQHNIAPTSIFLYVHAVKSYLLYHDIDINHAKFRRKVRLPKIAREDEQPIDASDIRKLLLACNNRRIKVYLLVLASGGMRANEGLAIRLYYQTFI